MNVEVLVAVVFCVGFVYCHPLRESSSFLGLGGDKTSSSSAAAAKDGARQEGDVNGRPWEATLRNLRLGSGVNGERLDSGRSHSAGGPQKRQFGEYSSWNSLDAPDPFFNPIHLQNWSSQFGRNYRAFNGGGHQSTGRLRPEPSGLHQGGAGIFGDDGFQDWRAVYRDDRF